ncbi:MAG: ABC transporter ATP-binding protein [Bacillota bacterium]|nr:ABC transporter ATP-binding protein [Bacillota bacterium]
MLKISHFSKSYDGKKKACDDVSLTVEAGEIYGFIGHNGAGKTTLLKSIAGILDFEAGTIEIDCKSIKTEPLEAKRVIAYIPDNPDVYETLTGLQFLNFVADIFGIPVAERKPKIERHAGMFDLLGVLNDSIATYSHGMKQKLVIISALIHDPKVFILDEPFVGLDPKAAYQLKEIFRDLCAKGALVFFSTHILEVAEKLCTKVAIIKQGKIVAAGTTAEITKDQSLESVFLELIEK